VSIAPLLLAALLGPPSGRSLLAELEQLDRALTAAEENLLSAETRQDQLKKELARIQTQQAVTLVRQAEAFTAYQKRVRALAKMPAGARLVLLGGSRSLADYLAATRVLRWVAHHDRSLHEVWVKQSRDLETIAAQLGPRARELDALRIKLRHERDQQASARGQRLALLESVTSDTKLRQLAAQERTYARKELAGMVSRLAPQGAPQARFVANRGRLAWPTVGKIDVGFGQQVELSSGTVTSHNGLDIRAQAGSAVQAIAAGEVVFGDWLKGYGRLVIIDHGEHYHSLVAHLATIAVNRGDMVAQGRIVGTVGDTGSLRGTVLYFEIRHKGVPVNPGDWLR